MNNVDCNNCIEKRKLNFEHFRVSIDDETRYASIICSIFYISLLTFYCSFPVLFNSSYKKVFLISYIVSVGMFVLNEMMKMLKSYKEYTYKTEQWQNLNNKKITQDELEENIRIKVIDLYSDIEKWWLRFFIAGCISGFISVISLVIGVWRLC